MGSKKVLGLALLVITIFLVVGVCQGDEEGFVERVFRQMNEEAEQWEKRRVYEAYDLGDLYDDVQSMKKRDGFWSKLLALFGEHFTLPLEFAGRRGIQRVANAYNTSKITSSRFPRGVIFLVVVISLYLYVFYLIIWRGLFYLLTALTPVTHGTAATKRSGSGDTSSRKGRATNCKLYPTLPSDSDPIVIMDEKYTIGKKGKLEHIV